MGMLSYIREEIRVVKERDPAIKSSMEVLLYPSFKVILRYRVAHKLYLKKHSGQMDFPACSQKNGNRDPSGRTDRERAVY